MKRIILATTLLAGTVIGAGIFSLPFVFSQAGIVGGAFFGVIAAIIASCVFLMYGDLIMRDHGHKRLIGLARFYFKRKGLFGALMVNGTATLFVLTTYLVLSASFMKIFFPSIPFLFLVVLFWLISAWAIFVRLKKEAQFEFLATMGIGIVIVMILIFGIGHFDEFSLSFSPTSPLLFILPLGAFLFSLGGRAVIPDVVTFLKKDRSAIIKSVYGGIFSSLALYFLFIIGVVSMSDVITPDGIGGLVKLPFQAQVVLGALGIFALWSSFISNGSDLFRSLNSDVGIPPVLSGSIVVFTPLLLVFIGFQDFLMLVSIVGGIFLAAEWSLIVSMWISSKKKNKNSSSLIPHMNTFGIVIILLVLFVSVCYSIYSTLFL